MAHNLETKMKETVRFFNEEGDEEFVEIEASDEWTMQDAIDLAWEDNDRESRFEAVE